MKSIKIGTIYILFAIFGVSSAFILTLYLVKKTWAQSEVPVEDITQPNPMQRMHSGDTPALKQLENIEAENLAMPQLLPDPNLSGADTDENYNYIADGKRDPFEPYTFVEPTAPIIARQEVDDPLLKYDLDQYEVAGVIWGTEHSKVYISTPEKKYYTLYKGARIGNNNGVIVGFREGLIIVQEVSNETGVPVSVLRKLSIKGLPKKGVANE